MPIPLCMAVPFIAKKRLSSPLWVGSVESPVSPDHLFTVFDSSNNVEFLVDTGSSISLLPGISLLVITTQVCKLYPPLTTPLYPFMEPRIYMYSCQQGPFILTSGLIR